MNSLLRKPWWLSIVALGLWQGCGEPQAPVVQGSNLIVNGSFEGKLDPWWTANDSVGGTGGTSPAAADIGSSGMMLHKGKGGWGYMVGQETSGHSAMQTFQFKARIRGALGGERVNVSFHGQSFDVIAEPVWRTVDRLVLMPDGGGGTTAMITATSDDSTIHVDDVSAFWVEVARGDADNEDGNLLRNASFESDLGLWTFWADVPEEGRAWTTPNGRSSGYAGLALTRGPSGALTTLKQMLQEPVFQGEKYRVEARVRGEHGGEQVNLCLQMKDEPWTGPCIQVTASTQWQHASETVSIEEDLNDKRVGVLVSLSTEGTAYVDDVIVVRTQRR